APPEPTTPPLPSLPPVPRGAPPEPTPSEATPPVPPGVTGSEHAKPTSEALEMRTKEERRGRMDFMVSWSAEGSRSLARAKAGSRGSIRGSVHRSPFRVRKLPTPHACGKVPVRAPAGGCSVSTGSVGCAPMRVLFTSLRNIGHFQPLVPLIEACRRSGHDVRVATPRDLEARVQRTGATFVPVGHPGDDGLRPLWQHLRQLPASDQNTFAVARLFAGACAEAALP